VNAHPLGRGPLAALCFVSLASAPARADLLVGRVVGPGGVGVAGVNIDVENLGSGGDPVLSGDLTNASGFFSVQIPGGLYDVTFLPPAPPTAVLLGQTLPAIAVVGTVNLGDVTLTPGFVLTARAVDPLGQPVAGIDVDLFDLGAAASLPLSGDQTDVLGQVTVVVPQGPFEIEFNAKGVSGPPLVSKSLELDLTGPANLGNLVFPYGFWAKGKVLGPGGAAVVGADVDVKDASGAEVVTPGDNTDSVGQFEVVVPAGVLDFRLCPPTDLPLAGVELAGVAVAADVDLGDTFLPSGISLTGTVTTFQGQPASGADVDLIHVASGLSIFLCSDGVQADGSYGLKAPAGLYHVVFEPADFQVPLGSQSVHNLLLQSPQQVNGVLPSCPLPLEFGVGTPGAGGAVPDLASYGGTARVGNPDFGLSLGQLAGGSFGALVVGFVPTSLPLFGGTLYVNPLGPVVSFPYTAGGVPGLPGAGTAQFPIAVAPGFVGVSFVAQAYVVDLGAPGFLALSDAVSTTFCP
jgi:hypothetical protein